MSKQKEIIKWNTFVGFSIRRRQSMLQVLLSREYSFKQIKNIERGIESLKTEFIINYLRL